jgi:signal transduction histidine kinase
MATQPHRKIFIVDDEGGIRDLIVDALREAYPTYQILEAESGTKALQLIDQEVPDIVVSDISMPGLDGIGLLAKIREKHPDVLVILLTARSEKENIRRCLRLGAFDFLDKPCDLEDLVTCVQRADSTCRLKEDLKESQVFAAHVEKLALMGEIAGGIVHEIRNPLAVIFGNTHLIKQELESDALDKASIGEKVDKIDEHTQRIDKIVKSLQNIARKNGSTGFKPTAIKSILEDVMNMCREKFHKYGITVEIGDVPGDLTVNCNPIQIAQVLINLFNNSFYEIKEKPKKWIHVEVVNQNEMVQISVTDSGNGIEEGLRTKIFQPLFTTKPARDGMGLGLSIVNRIVLNHGGTVSVDPRSKHTCFVIRIPAHPGGVD